MKVIFNEVAFLVQAIKACDLNQDNSNLAGDYSTYAREVRSAEKGCILYSGVLSKRYVKVSSNIMYSSEAYLVGVPFDVMMEFDKACGNRQTRYLDLTDKGQKKMLEAYEGGEETFRAFVEDHCEPK